MPLSLKAELRTQPVCSPRFSVRLPFFAFSDPFFAFFVVSDRSPSCFPAKNPRLGCSRSPFALICVHLRSRSAFRALQRPPNIENLPQMNANTRKWVSRPFPSTPNIRSVRFNFPIRAIRQIRSFPSVFRDFRSSRPRFGPLGLPDSPRCQFFTVPGPFGHLCGRFLPATYQLRPRNHVRIFCNSCHFQASQLTARLPTCKAPPKPSRFRIGNKRAIAFDQHK